MKKKRKRCLATIEDGYDSAKRNGALVLDGLPLQPSKNRVADNDLQNMVLDLNHDSGLFLGLSEQFGKNSYIGVPQGIDGNIAIIGGNGSGKSFGIAKSTLRTWQGAIFATDIKGELSQCYRHLYQFGLVERPFIVFDPMDKDTPSYDPILFLIQDDEDNLVSNIEEIALAIIPKRPEDKNPFWEDSERGILAAALLHYFNLGLSFSEILSKIVEEPLLVLSQKLEKSDDIRVKMLLGQTSGIKDETLAAIDRGLRNKLSLFVVDPRIAHALRGKREGARSFHWNDLENYNIFLLIPEDKIEHWGGVIRLMCTQLIRYLERRPDKYSIKGARNIQTLLLLDEFARFGKLEVIAGAMATPRSKSVNICLIIQSVAQLDKNYGEYDRRIIFDNCQFQAILRSNDADTQRYLAEIIGSCIRHQHSISEQLNESMNTTGYSRQINEAREWNVFPHELSMLDDIVLLSPYGFYQVDKLQPDSKLAGRLMFDLNTIRSRTSKLASIHDPVYFPPDNPIRNEGTEMLTIQGRSKNASNRLTAFQHQQRVKEKQQRDAKEKKDRLRKFIVGEMVIEFFPELTKLEPGAHEENETIFGPLKAFLIELASDQKLVNQLKEQAQRRDLKNIVFNGSGTQCVDGHADK